MGDDFVDEYYGDGDAEYEEKYGVDSGTHTNVDDLSPYDNLSPSYPGSTDDYDYYDNRPLLDTKISEQKGESGVFGSGSQEFIPDEEEEGGGGEDDAWLYEEQETQAERPEGLSQQFSQQAETPQRPNQQRPPPPAQYTQPPYRVPHQTYRTGRQYPYQNTAATTPTYQRNYGNNSAAGSFDYGSRSLVTNINPRNQTTATLGGRHKYKFFPNASLETSAFHSPESPGKNWRYAKVQRLVDCELLENQKLRQSLRNFGRAVEKYAKDIFNPNSGFDVTEVSINNCQNSMLSFEDWADLSSPSEIAEYEKKMADEAHLMQQNEELLIERDRLIRRLLMQLEDRAIDAEARGLAHVSMF